MAVPESILGTVTHHNETFEMDFTLRVNMRRTGESGHCNPHYNAIHIEVDHARILFDPLGSEEGMGLGPEGLKAIISAIGLSWKLTEQCNQAADDALDAAKEGDVP